MFAMRQTERRSGNVSSSAARCTISRCF